MVQNPLQIENLELEIPGKATERKKILAQMNTRGSNFTGERIKKKVGEDQFE
jgi:hypothetical protein